MLQIYSLALWFYQFIIKLMAPFNPKAKKWSLGRKKWRSKLKDLLKGEENLLWFHAASLGEAEQGLPVIQKLKSQYPKSKILLTFFSPSGFENFNEDDSIDFTFYLPMDSKSNAKDFIAIAQPKIAVFIKYEIWVHYFNQLSATNTPLFLTSALFREDQVYFKKPWSRFFLSVLNKVNHIMVQNEDSALLLKQHKVNHVSVCGETRIDRVLDLMKTDYSNPILEQFTKNAKTLIAGSSWPIEEEMILKAEKKLTGVKIILAPHDISRSHISQIEKIFSKRKIAFYSNKDEDFSDKEILIIDNIGLLSKIYRFADIAFIGGGYGKGLHSTIEASVYGLPVIFGPNHKSFLEPSELIKCGAGFEIDSQAGFDTLLDRLLNNVTDLDKSAKAASDFVLSKSGAVDHIVSKIEKHSKLN